MYLDLFKDNESIITAYDAPIDALDGATVYLAVYRYEDYSGSSLVVFEKDGTLYEVNGSHCSCYGLEGQWNPEETSWGALKMKTFWYYEDDQVDYRLQDLVKNHIGE